LTKRQIRIDGGDVGVETDHGVGEHQIAVLRRIQAAGDASIDDGFNGIGGKNHRGRHGGVDFANAGLRHNHKNTVHPPQIKRVIGDGFDGHLIQRTHQCGEFFVHSSDNGDHSATFPRKKRKFTFSRYLISTTSMVNSWPVSDLNDNLAPFFEPISTLPMGDSLEILPCSGLASKWPTIVYSLAKSL